MNVGRNELAPITRRGIHARIIMAIAIQILHTCQSAVLIAAGHGLPWTAAILQKTPNNLLSPTEAVVRTAGAKRSAPA
jgi:hypothetical protein